MARGARSAEGETASYSVVSTVAAREDVEPTALTPALNEVVDPDALDRLFPDGAGSRDGPAGRVEFRYCGYDVTVYSDGRIEVDE